MPQVDFVLVGIDEVYKFMFDVFELGVAVDGLGESDSVVYFYVSVGLLLWPASFMLGCYEG